MTVIDKGAATALTIAGSDSGGGAGVQADLKTFSALGVYGASVITALTAQNTRDVRGIHAPPADFVAAQLDAVFDDIRIDAIKIGMLSNRAVIAVVADRLRALPNRPPIVLDPVMVAKSGDALLSPDAITALRERLLPLATLVTPNLPEAAVLLNVAPDALPPPEQTCRQLHALGAQAVLLKGGHAAGEHAVDWLFDGSAVHEFSEPRVETPHTHGTGCTLSSAIAAGMAQGCDLRTAVADAKRYVTAAIRAAAALHVGHGHGPVHHFHAQWRDD